MCDTYRVRVVENFWYEGRSYKVNEILFLSDSTIKELGEHKFKKESYLDSVRFDRMIKESVHK